MALEALSLTAIAFMLGTGGYLFLTRPRVTNAEARKRLFGERSAALGKRPGRGGGPKGPSAADTHTQSDVRTHRDGAATR
jgi:hypothetical protein